MRDVVSFMFRATELNARLNDSDSQVRLQAVETLGNREPAALAAYAPALVAKLGGFRRSRAQDGVSGLSKIGPAVLAMHASVIAATNSRHSDWRVRYAAMGLLGKLEPGVLAQHAPAIVARLQESRWQVRVEVVETLGKLRGGWSSTCLPSFPCSGRFRRARAQ